MLLVNNGKVPHAGPHGSGAIPAEYLAVLNQALHIIQLRIVGHYQSDLIFKALPGGKSFQDMFNNLANWVNYDPSNKQGDWGWTIPTRYPHDVVVTQFTLRMGRWSTAGTIVHELAHLNGADGTSHAAENTLRFCGLQSTQGPYNPHIRG